MLDLGFLIVPLHREQQTKPPGLQGIEILGEEVLQFLGSFHALHVVEQLLRACSDLDINGKVEDKLAMYAIVKGGGGQLGSKGCIERMF